MCSQEIDAAEPESKEIININHVQYSTRFVNSFSTNRTATKVDHEKIVHQIQVNFGGYDKQIREIITLIYASIFDISSKIKARGILIHGPSGTGKSKLLKLIANTFDIHTIHINPSILTKK